MTGWQEVGDGCFRRRYASFDLNIGVVRGSDALLVVDTRADLSEADELLKDLVCFGQPVRWVVNSHWHFDHVFGNQRFAERADRPDDGDGRMVDICTDVELWGHAELPSLLLADEAALRAALREAYGSERAAEFDRVVLTPPSHLVATSHLLDLGDRGVELVHVGRGHTSSDLAVVAPDAGVTFAGDLLEESGPPAYGPDSYPLEWPATARELVELGSATFVPGHGDVLPASAARDQAAAIATVAGVIRELHDAGIGVEAALEEGAGRWPFPVPALGQAVRRAYAALG